VPLISYWLSGHTGPPDSPTFLQSLYSSRHHRVRILPDYPMSVSWANGARYDAIQSAIYHRGLYRLLSSEKVIQLSRSTKRKQTWQIMRRSKARTALSILPRLDDVMTISSFQIPKCKPIQQHVHAMCITRHFVTQFWRKWSRFLTLLHRRAYENTTFP
jgi:hypothetical protein